MNIGEGIVRLRQLKNLTQQELADATVAAVYKPIRDRGYHTKCRMVNGSSRNIMCPLILFLAVLPSLKGSRSQPMPCTYLKAMKLSVQMRGGLFWI